MWPIQNQLALVQTASDRRFATFQMRTFQVTQESTLASLNTMMEAADSAAQERLDAATQEIKLLQEAMDEVGGFRDAAQKLLDMVTELERVLTWFKTESGGSAGGLLSSPLTIQDRPRRGFPWATADIRWTCNTPPPGGWFECNGAHMSIQQNPALAAVIGKYFGTTDDDTMFKMPQRDECPGYFPGLADIWRPVMRV